MKPDVSVIVVNFNGLRHLKDCFSSLQAGSFRNFELLFVDNGSSDTSCDYVSRQYPWVKILSMGYNSGFSKANNYAVHRAEGRYLAFLNNDIETDPGWLEHLVAAAEKNKKVSAFASKMRLYDLREILNGVGGCMNRVGYTWDRGMFEPDRGQYDRSEEVFFACAGACLMRREAFEAAGGFDELFFMYHEDVDLCWTLRQMGGDILTVPQAVVYHKFGGTSAETMGTGRREYMGERHNICSLIKHYEAGNLMRAIVSLMNQYRSPQRKWIFLGNLAWNLRRLPAILARRSRIRARKQRRDEDLASLIFPSKYVPLSLPDYSLTSREAFLASKRTVYQITMGENEIGCLYYGWYPLEPDPVGKEKQVRWTQREAALFLRRRPVHRRICLNVIAMGKASGFPTAGTVAVNRGEEVSFRFPADGPQKIVIDLPEGDDCLELTIRLAKTWSPDSIYHNGDRRHLGIAVQKIWLE